MGPFNNRELATALWALVIFILILRTDAGRSGLRGVGSAFFVPKILAIVGLMLLYSTMVVALLAAAGLWELVLLKDTLMWFSFGALGMMTRFATMDHVDNFFRKVLVENVKFVIILQFLINSYTFPLVIELILMPLLVLIIVVSTVADSDKSYARVSDLSMWTQAIIGFSMLGLASTRAILDFQELAILDAVRSIALVPALSLLLSPFLYFVILVFKYELIFVRLNMGVDKSHELKRYARRRVLLCAHISLRRVQVILSTRAVDLMHVETTTDVDRLLESRANS